MRRMHSENPTFQCIHLAIIVGDRVFLRHLNHNLRKRTAAVAGRGCVLRAVQVALRLRNPARKRESVTATASSISNPPLCKMLRLHPNIKLPEGFSGKQITAGMRGLVAVGVLPRWQLSANRKKKLNRAPG